MEQIKKAWDYFKKKWMERDTEIRAPRDTRAEFRLSYGDIPIGILSVKDGIWTFRYSEEFRRHPDMRPLVGFSDVNKVYQSEDLWPFFGMRIPSLKRAAIREIVRKECLDENDEVQLLRRFGKRTISSPFVLTSE